MVVKLLAELNKIKLLLFLELAILIISAFLNFYPFYILCAILLLTILSYYSFYNPIIIIYIFMLSILIDAFLFKEVKSSNPSILLVEFDLLFFLFIVILKSIINFQIITKHSDLVLIWIPFLIWSLIIGLLVAVDKFRIISYWKNYFAGFFVFFITYYLIPEDSKKKLIIPIIVWGVLLTLIELRIFFELGGFVRGFLGLFLKKNLLNVGWGKSNYVASFFVIIIPIAIGYLLFINSRIGKVFIFISIVFMIFGIIITLSRGGIIALFFALCILLLKTLKPKLLIPLFLLLSTIILVTALNPLTYILLERISNLESSFSVYSRINYYKDVWRAFLDHPFTGVGFGNLSYYSKFILGPDLSPSAHNILLGALGELGIFGTILYLMIFYVVIKRAYKNYKFETNRELKLLKWAFLSSIIGGVIHSLVEPTFEGIQYSIIFWIIAAISVDLKYTKQISIR